MSEIQKGDLVPAVLGGRAANGYERDKGQVVHAVKVINAAVLDLSGTAACGKTYGARSIGFVARKELPVTCPKCLKEFVKVKTWAVCDPYIVKAPNIVAWFDTEEQANAWLESKVAADDDGYSGCVVLPKDSALANYG